MKIARIAIASLSLVASAAYAAPEAVISFSAPTKYTDGTPITAEEAKGLSYNLYQAEAGSPKVKVATITTLGTTVTTGLVAGKSYCFSVTAVLAGQESPQAPEQCKSFRIPEAVVITVR